MRVAHLPGQVVSAPLGSAIAFAEGARLTAAGIPERLTTDPRLRPALR